MVALLGFAWLCATPAYFVLQARLSLGWRGGWRLASLVPLPLAALALGWCVYALSQDSNLWPMAFIAFAPIGVVYLLALMLLRHFQTAAA